MKRLPVLLIIVLLCFPAFADINQEIAGKAVSAAADCFSAALVANYSPVKVSIPSTAISVDTDTQLPQRVAFFLADPADYVSAINSSMNISGQNFLANITGFLSKTASDPLLSAVFVSMSMKNYRPSDYLVSGFIAMSYPEGFSLESVKKALENKDISSQSLGLSLSLNIFGNKLPEPFSIDGTFTVNSDEKGLITIVPSGVYTVNGADYQGGILTFQEFAK